MKKYSFNSESLQREPLDPKTVEDGDIVAFEWYINENSSPKKGVACMGGHYYFYAAYNLYRDADDEDGIWTGDEMPEDVVYYHPTKEEFKLALEKFGKQFFEFINFSYTFTHPINTSLDNIIKQLEAPYKEQQEIAQSTVSYLQSVIKERDDIISKSISRDLKSRETEQKLIEAEKQIIELKAAIEELKKIPSEDDFVKRLVKETKKLYKHEKEKTEVIRQILYKVGRLDAEAELDAWIEDRQKPLVNIERATDVIANGGRKIINNHE